MAIKIVVVYHSGYGHTAKVAQYVNEGAKAGGADSELVDVEKLSDESWKKLDEADAIIFGCPTYMGSVSAKMKLFFEQASGRWAKQVWKDKIAAGFTNSGGLSGDKLNTMFDLYINAMQHSMIWVSLGEMGPSHKGTEVASVDEVNRIACYSGAMAQSNNDSPDITPPAGDLETARRLGIRVAAITKQFRK